MSVITISALTTSFTNLAPTETPEGQLLTKSVLRSLLPVSLRHRPGNFSRGIARIMPEQRDVEATPPVKLT
jgi:hypothetical protein